MFLSDKATDHRGRGHAVFNLFSIFERVRSTVVALNFWDKRQLLVGRFWQAELAMGDKANIWPRCLTARSSDTTNLLVHLTGS